MFSRSHSWRDVLPQCAFGRTKSFELDVSMTAFDFLVGLFGVWTHTNYEQDTHKQ